MKVCLIGGSGRSGTTVLNSVMGRHPQLADFPEWRFMTDPDGVLDFYTNLPLWSPYHYERRYKRLISLLRGLEKKHPNIRLSILARKLGLEKLTHKNIFPAYGPIETLSSSPNFKTLVNQLAEDLKDFSFDGYWVGMAAGAEKVFEYAAPNRFGEIRAALIRFAHGVAQDVCQHQGVDYYLEKSTWNILWFDKLLDFFPDAKMVHIYRDPRDVISSFTKQSWMPNDAVQAATIYNDLINRWEAIKEDLKPDQYFELSLDQLVSDTEGKTRQICEFWDIPWSDKVLEHDLSRSNSGRWKKDLPAHQLAEVEKIVKPHLDRWGY